jgi:YjbE family integral membrane protein
MLSSIGLANLADVVTPILQICLIDLMLGGDNALVIAMACRGLPPRIWRRVMWLGTAAAVLLRIVLTALAAMVLHVPYLKLVGAALLLGIAIKLLNDEPHSAERSDDAPLQQSVLKAVMTIIVADTVMSLDNVLAVAAAARGSLWLLAFGLALSIPIVIFGSVAVARLLARFPLLIVGGGALLGWVAGDTAVSDPVIRDWVATHAWITTAAAPIGAVYVLIHARLVRPRRAAPAAGATKSGG